MTYPKVQIIPDPDPDPQLWLKVREISCIRPSCPQKLRYQLKISEKSFWMDSQLCKVALDIRMETLD